MATTRIMPLHIGKGRTESRAISEIIDYVANPQKTDHGRLITGYECDSRVADAEFMWSGRCDRLPCPPVLLPWGDHPGRSQPSRRGICQAVHQGQTRLYRLHTHRQGSCSQSYVFPDNCIEIVYKVHDLFE